MRLRLTIIFVAIATMVTAYGVLNQPVEPAQDAAGVDSPAGAAPTKFTDDMSEAHSDAGRHAAFSESTPDNCTIVTHYLPNDDGTTTEAISCEPNEPTQEHPYAGYPDEALESLAYSDAKAAQLLSIRLRESDSEAAMSLALRAAALAGGDATPVVAFANAYPEPTAVNGVPVRSTVHVKYVLGTVTRLLGDPRHSTPYFEAVIREQSEDPEREIALLNERARQIIEEMRQIQLDVTGSSTIGG